MIKWHAIEAWRHIMEERKREKPCGKSVGLVDDDVEITGLPEFQKTEISGFENKPKTNK